MTSNTQHDTDDQDGPDHGEGHSHERTITVTVNDESVVLDNRKQTGAEIKNAAVASGVPIQLDFVLSQVLPNGKQKIVPDDKEINIKDGDAFWAIPGDDNS